MSSLSDQIFDAVEAFDLEWNATATDIEILIGTRVIAKLGCDGSQRPKATLSGTTVTLHPSPGMSGNMQIECGNVEEAEAISKILDQNLQQGFRDFTDPDR